MSTTATQTQQADFSILDEGSVIMFTPLNQVATEWLDEHTETEGWQWLGAGLCVDHRLAQGLLDGIQAERFTIQ